MIDLFDYAGSGIIDITAGNPVAPPVPVAPRAEVVASTPTRSGHSLGFLAGIDRCGRGWHSREIYMRMDDCPAVGASFDALRYAVLAGSVKLTPALEDEPAGEPAASADAAMAAEVCATNARTLHALETPIDLVLHEVIHEAMTLGHAIPELVYDDVKGGPDDGLWYTKAIKPRAGCTFRVDPGMNVVGIEATTYKPDGTTERLPLDPAHFAPLTWDQRHGDPRGRSCYRMAVDPWRKLEELWPDVMDGWQQFGRPLLCAGIPRDQPQYPGEDGKPVNPLKAASDAMDQLRFNRNLAHDAEGRVYVVESGKESADAAASIGELESRIVLAILDQTRATQEAEFGSRADSKTGQDIMGAKVRFVRKWLERWVRSILMKQNTLNYGPDVARRCTPLVDLGATGLQDFAATATAIAALAAAGLILPSQYPAVFAMLGMSMPTEAELAMLTKMVEAKLAGATAPTDPNAPADPQQADPAGGAA